ncbi:MAG: 30S ribosomal protein S16 [Candidatus Riflebacteria bacterium]|nr:30S ribosomal protein S16 [Candidatus Riflebacteria bacterium]
MSVALRLKKMGTKNRPFFRIVALDCRKTRDGKSLANLGHYNPLTNPATVVLDEERILGFLKTGAVPSETVLSLLNQKGIIHEAKQWVKKPQ